MYILISLPKLVKKITNIGMNGLNQKNGSRFK